MGADGSLSRKSATIHICHLPQEHLPSEKRCIKFTDEQVAWMTKEMEDPLICQGAFSQRLCRQFRGITVRENQIKSFMAKHRKAQLGTFTFTQKTVDAMQENGDWYAWCDDKDGDLSAVLWATMEQQEWIKEHGAEAALDCTYGTNKKMLYFEATAVSHTGKIVPLFQGVASSEKEECFRRICLQIHNLYMHCGVKDPRYLCTEYYNGLFNAIEYQFDGIKHQICIFHINMNLTLNIKKKWKRPAEATAAANNPQRDPPHPNDIAPPVEFLIWVT